MVRTKIPAGKRNARNEEKLCTAKAHDVEEDTKKIPKIKIEEDSEDSQNCSDGGNPTQEVQEKEETSTSTSEDDDDNDERGDNDNDDEDEDDDEGEENDEDDDSDDDDEEDHNDEKNTEENENKGKKRDPTFLNHRCYNKKYNAIMSEMNLTEEQLSRMRSSAFVNLIQMPLLSIEIRFLEEIIVRYKEGCTFELALKFGVKLGVAQVGALLGISAGTFSIRPLKNSEVIDDVGLELFGKDWHLTKKEKKDDGKKGPGKAQVRQSKFLTKDNLEKLWIKYANSTNKEDIENMCRAWMLYLLATFLIPESTCRAPAFILHYLKDVADTTELNWAELVHKKIFENLEKIKTELINKKCVSTKKTIYVTGCMMCLCAWALELVKLAKSKIDTIRPRIYKWAAHLKMEKTLSDITSSNMITLFKIDDIDRWDAIAKGKKMPIYFLSKKNKRQEK